MSTVGVGFVLFVAVALVPLLCALLVADMLLARLLVWELERIYGGDDAPRR